jgi:hypothetical protein
MLPIPFLERLHRLVQLIYPYPKTSSRLSCSSSEAIDCTRSSVFVKRTLFAARCS